MDNRSGEHPLLVCQCYTIGGHMQHGSRDSLHFKYLVCPCAYGTVCSVNVQMIGVAKGALDSVIPYLHERMAFGQPIADFQVGSGCVSVVT